MGFINCGSCDQNQYLIIHKASHRNNLKLTFYLVKDCEVLIVDSLIKESEVGRNRPKLFHG
jgi:hypothetical protein